MSKTKIAIAIVSALSVGTFAWYKKHEKLIVERFPNEDPTLVKKHYNEIFRDILAQRLKTDDWEDDDFDRELERRLYNDRP